jgi:hypothetical protein
MTTPRSATVAAVARLVASHVSDGTPEDQIADLREEWITEQRDRLIDAVGECPL